ncbi:MAG TPA: 5-formyltetrahydrofolate cyclo-ligase [Rhizomicrobium sp.]|nr:5-formyltetrahydrofolate cyclo-ligase [Rhizomicrobium sp.]
MIAKIELRKLARQKRKTLAHPDIAAVLANHAPALGLQPGAIVGGYHALAEEADPSLLLDALAAAGCRIAFPRMVAKDKPLEFHLVPDGESLKPGAFGIHEPSGDWPLVMPHLLLVPLLAFDAEGHRLGFGGGFYDRTLNAFHIRAIGIAFSGQQVESLPHEAHDVALDGVLTERGLTTHRE